MDLSSLEIFRAVAHEASVTRAAQQLQRAQSNVTTRIRQLEEDLGVELFLRDGKRMSLTERGSEFLAYAEQLLALADEARQSMHPAEPGGRLRLGSMESTAASRLPALLASYHKACPRVALEVSTGTSRALFDGVRARRLDCALVAAGPGWAGELDGSGLRGEPLFREELLMILPAEHPPVHDVAEVRGRLRPWLHLPATGRRQPGHAADGAGSRLLPCDPRLRRRRRLCWRAAALGAATARHTAAAQPAPCRSRHLAGLARRLRDRRLRTLARPAGPGRRLSGQGRTQRPGSGPTPSHQNNSEPRSCP